MKVSLEALIAIVGLVVALPPSALVLWALYKRKAHPSKKASSKVIIEYHDMIPYADDPTVARCRPYGSGTPPC